MATNKNVNNVTLKELRDNFYHLRDFELTNLWQRSILLTALLVSLFPAYGTVVVKLLKKSCDNNQLLSIVCCLIALAGISLSIIWIMMAKGSKAWFEIYEKKINKIEQEKVLKIPEYYQMGEDIAIKDINSCLFSTKAGKYSVSKLNIMIGIILLYIWISIFVFHCLNIITFNLDIIIDKVIIAIILFLIFVVILITALCNCRVKSSSLESNWEWKDASAKKNKVFSTLFKKSEKNRSDDTLPLDEINKKIKSYRVEKLKPSMYAVIDTNVLVSALLTSKKDTAAVKILDAIFYGKIHVIVHKDILTEYKTLTVKDKEVLSRIKTNFKKMKLKKLLNLFAKNGIFLDRTKSNENIPDQTNAMFYELILTATSQFDKAYLITDDITGFLERTYVVSPSDFIQILEKE